MHYTGMLSGEAALEHLCKAGSGVSAHYLVEENGQIIQMVEEDRRAWHAGVAHWRGKDNINDRSIGIEIVNPGHEHGYRPFPEKQIDAVRELTQDIMERHEIEPQHVVGHSDIAPLRKQDPGEYFPWEMLAKHHIGIWHGCDNTDHIYQEANETTYNKLHKLGYKLPATLEENIAIITAFQRHWHPEYVTGEWNTVCEARLDALLTKIS